MNDKLSSLWNWLKSLPIWLRGIVLVLISALVLIASMSLSACGQTVKVTVRDTSSGVQISTTQNKRDSSGTNISIKPTITFNKP